MSHNYLGNPTAQEVDKIRDYVNQKYKTIDTKMLAIQHEIDNLNHTVAHLRIAESRLASIYGKTNLDFSLLKFNRAPILNEDLSYFEQHRLSNPDTASVVDGLLKPWYDEIKREMEHLDYKIRKTMYLIERKQTELTNLQNLQDDLRDQGVQG